MPKLWIKDKMYAVDDSEIVDYVATLTTERDELEKERDRLIEEKSLAEAALVKFEELALHEQVGIEAENKRLKEENEDFRTSDGWKDVVHNQTNKIEQLEALLSAKEENLRLCRLHEDEIEGLCHRYEIALEELARLGNGEYYGNSDGNIIAQQALNPKKESESESKET